MKRTFALILAALAAAVTALSAVPALAAEQTGPGEWAVSDLFLRRPRVGASPFGKGPTVFAAWNQISEKNTAGEAQSAEQLIATYSDLLPADLATTLLDLPEERRLEVTEELPDGRLADALEEMSEEDQVELINHLDPSLCRGHRHRLRLGGELGVADA